MVVSASIEISVIASVRFSSALSMSMIYAFATKLPTPAIEFDEPGDPLHPDMSSHMPPSTMAVIMHSAFIALSSRYREI